MVDVVCNRCEETKDSTFDFYWSQDKRQRWCKECMRGYSNEWQKMHVRRVDGKRLKKGERRANI